MLYVKQAKYHGGIVEIGQFTDIKAVYNYCRNLYIYYPGASRISARFSHNFDEIYSNGGTFYNDINGTLRLTEREYCYVIENSSGIRYSRDTVYGLFNKLDKPHKNTRYFYGRNKHYRSHYRHIATTQERRFASGILLEEGEVPPRAKRNLANLPNAWDEYPHFDVYDRNWKRYRKKQYKESGRI